MRKSSIISIGSVTVALLVMSATTAFASSDNHHGKSIPRHRKSIPQQITSLQSQITSLQSDIASLQSTVSSQSQEISHQATDISNQKGEIAALQSTTQQQTTDISKQQSDITSLQSTVNQQAFTGTFTSKNNEYSISVTDTGITLSGPNSNIILNSSGLKIKESTGGITVEGETGVILKVNGNKINLDQTGVTVNGTLVNINGSSGIGIQSNGYFNMTGSAVMNVKNTGILNIDGSLIDLNGGARPVSGVGDAVAGSQIITGSPTVFMGK